VLVPLVIVVYMCIIRVSSFNAKACPNRYSRLAV